MIDNAILICVIGLIAHRFCALVPTKNLGPLDVFSEDQTEEKNDHDYSLLVLLTILCALLWAQILNAT